MPLRPKVGGLPDEVRRWLDGSLIDSDFSGYEALEAALAERGYSISKSAIHRYGQALQRRMDTIRASTEAAQAIVTAAGDEADARSGAVMAMVQTEMFDVLLRLQESTEDGVSAADRVALLSEAARGIAQLTRASIAQKKWAQDVSARAKDAAAKAAKIAKKGGMSAEAADQIRALILGIAA
ncbi:MAG: DUF3486 family protein [Rhodocyclaceae bacterium]|nr:DUF3486 family protein [Rhodocyclaceae bacterium]